MIMNKIAITGGIGSGKSFICRSLEKRGCLIYDCDSAAKRLMTSSCEIQLKLKSVVGEDVFVNGVLNKAAMAKFLLEGEQNAQKVNGIVHPAVAEDFIRSGLSWMECAILFSSGFDKLVDKVVCVTAPLEIRMARIISRDGISGDKALEWINKQMPQEEVAELSDFVIENDGRKNIEVQIDQMLASLEMATGVIK